MAYETIETIANTAARPSPVDGMIRYQQDIQSCIVYDSGASAWKVFTPDDAPYDLDGTNILSTTPKAHFDPAKINGVDATGNPSHGVSFGALGEVWKSKVNPDNVYTIAQASGASQPVWNSSGGTNGLPHFFSDLNNALYLNMFNWDSMSPAGSDLTIVTIFGKNPASASSYGGMGIGGFVNLLTGQGNWSQVGNVWFANTEVNDYLYFNILGGGYDSGPHPDINGITGADVSYLMTRQLVFKRDGTENKFFVDGSHFNPGVDDSTLTKAYVCNSLFKGNHYGIAGSLYEIILFYSALSDADLNKINAYVDAKYKASITGVTAASPAEITVANHGFQDDTTVVIAAVAGSPGAVNGTHLVTSTGTNTFTIPIDASASAYTSGGTAVTYKQTWS